MKKIVVSKNEAGQKLLKLLAKYLNKAPQSFLHKMLRKKNITLNGKKADGSELLCETDEVCLFLSDDTIASFRDDPSEGWRPRRPEEMKEIPQRFAKVRETKVVYEDEDILIMNKPTDVLSQKAMLTDFTLNEWVIMYLLEKGSLRKEELQTFRPGVCNRLDRNTSGLITAGKSLAGLQTLSALFKERTVHKDYLCIVCGQVKEHTLLKGYLEKDARTNKVTVEKEKRTQEGAYIETEYTPVKTSGDYTLLKVRLITGKTHQIRAHLASVGYPLAGDPKYGKAEENKRLSECYGLKNQLLHAAFLEFPQEMSGCRQLSGKRFYAPVPKEFEQIAKELGVYDKCLSG